MRLDTPDSLLYPITVTKLLRQPGDDIDQNAPLFTYQYKSTVTEWDPDKREDVQNTKNLYADFESELEGTITTLNVQKGQILHGRTTVADIEEACKHEIQFGGLCTNCGKDMTTVQYNSTAKNTERATVNTVHGHTQLLVSQAEAGKADEEAKRRLLDSKKLSLVVDLDQTIIHATVDPTIKAWQQDPDNPNHDAVKDVRSFQLTDSGPRSKDDCWYYIKLRPGLADFLKEVAQCYELHIYTMGTRAYAEEIVKIIDPDRHFFGQRILSRDESGSMTAKNLKRLFPVDSKMVVIIDDRGDVWQWSPNLVKVSPYDFFVGIGDINSSFLPKRTELDASATKAIKASITDGPPDNSTAATHNGPNGEVSAVDRLVTMAGNQDEGSMKEKVEEQSEQIADQMENQPLLKKQKILDAAEEEAKASPAVEATAELLAGNGVNKDEEPTPHSKYRHNLLQDDDSELQYLGKNLRTIHQAYYDEYSKEMSGSKGGRIADLRPGHSKKRSIDELDQIPDAAILMADIKSRVLRGVDLVFSGVVPLGVDIHSHDTAVWAKSFGATISENITKHTTHVIASPERRTAKVRQAAKKGGRIAIVTQGWLLACFRQWKKVKEDAYRVHSDAPTNGTARLPDSFESRDEGMLSSSDEEAALTEDEPETGKNTPNGLNIDTDIEDLEKHMPNDNRVDGSPTEQESPDYWADINDELDEFLGSDADNDSDAEISQSEDSPAFKTPPSGTKRKRDAEGESTDGDEVEAPSSKLQKRKREALGRTTSLTLMEAPSSNGSTPGATVGGNAAGGNGQAVDAYDGDDDLEAMLAAEMERVSDEE